MWKRSHDREIGGQHHNPDLEFEMAIANKPQSTVSELGSVLLARIRRGRRMNYLALLAIPSLFLIAAFRDPQSRVLGAVQSPSLEILDEAGAASASLEIATPASRQPQPVTGDSPPKGYGSSAGFAIGSPDSRQPQPVTGDSSPPRYDSSAGFAIGSPESSPPQPVATHPSPQSRPCPGSGTPVSSETQCGACAGSGVQDCSSCFGSGDHMVSTGRYDWEGNWVTEMERQDCGFCTGGQRKCGSCYGRGRK